MGKTIKLDRAFLVPMPGGLRRTFGPGDVPVDDLPAAWLESNRAALEATKTKPVEAPPAPPAPLAEPTPPALDNDEPTDMPGLPTDMPGRALLIDAGYDTLESVPRSVPELIEIPGIGRATAGQVLDWFNARA